MKMNQLLKVNFPAVEEYRISDRKGIALAMTAEGLYTFDYKTMTATARPLNFSLAKVNRAKFVDAVRGEYFARELTAIEAEAEKFAENDDAFFREAEAPDPEAKETYTAEEIAKAREVVAEAKRRIEVVRNVVTPLAKDSQSLTVKAIVSALRAEAMPAPLAKVADDQRAEAKRICEAVAKKYTAEEVAEARAVLADPDGFGTSKVADATEVVTNFELCEGQTQSIPNLKTLREKVSAFTESLWQECPAEGVEKYTYKCSHTLSVEVFQRIRTARKVSKKGNVTSGLASKDDIAREVVLAVLESLQAKARAEAKAPAKPKNAKPAEKAPAEAKAKAEVKPAPAKPKNAKPAEKAPAK